MHKTAARVGVILHDLFVFAALAYAAAAFFLRARAPSGEHSPFWVAASLLWLAFCAWSAWRDVAALAQGGGKRTANFTALLERRTQENGQPGFGSFFAFTILAGVIRLVVPALLQFL